MMPLWWMRHGQKSCHQTSVWKTIRMPQNNKSSTYPDSNTMNLIQQRKSIYGTISAVTRILTTLEKQENMKYFTSHGIILGELPPSWNLMYLKMRKATSRRNLLTTFPLQVGRRLLSP